MVAKVKNSKDNAYRRIQDLILQMDLKPGETITEIALSERLGIGRTPVREALKKLEQEGLIISVNRRKKVNILTIKELEDIFDIKANLESHVARKAARNCTEKDEKKLRVIMNEMKEISLTDGKPATDDDQRMQDWLQVDRKLHDYLFTMSGNEKIRQIIKNLDLQWQRLRLGIYTMEGRMQRSYQEHNAFVEEIIKGNAEKASELYRTHTLTVKKELINLFKLFHYPLQ